MTWTQDNDVLIKIQSKRIPLKFGKLNDMEWKRWILKQREFTQTLNFKCAELMLLRKIYCPCSFALDLAHLKCDVRTGPKGGFPLSHNFSVRTYVNFTRVNEIETIVGKVTRKRKSWTSLNFHVYAWSFVRCLYCIYARSHGKITQQWKSTLSLCSYYAG